MSIFVIIGAVFALGVLGYWVGHIRAVAASEGSPASLHSRPSYHGSFVMVWTWLPAYVLLAAWSIGQPIYTSNVMTSFVPEDVLEQEGQPALALSQIRLVQEGLTRLSEDERFQVSVGLREARAAFQRAGVPQASTIEEYMIEAGEAGRATDEALYSYRWMAVFAVAALGFAIALARIGRDLRSRNAVERVVRTLLMIASAVAIMTTVGIVYSMLQGTGDFFESLAERASFVADDLCVAEHGGGGRGELGEAFDAQLDALRADGTCPELPWTSAYGQAFADFFLDLAWDPGFSNAGEVDTNQRFGLLPLLWGTFFISVIALLVAVPVGLYAAVYMSEFASDRVRTVAKPLLEVLAGIPTIVYGFFALITVGPFLRDAFASVGIQAEANSVLTAGIVMGIMIVPFVSSLSDDIINAVPQSLRDGSYGLGATKAETVRLVVLPAALPGIVGAVLLAASRAIGETMIVLLAAGATASLSGDPLQAMTTVTVKIVSQLTGDGDFTQPEVSVAYALGTTLFVVTLLMNIFALRIVRKYREQYE